MGIFDGYLLLTDFDNTLSQKGTISDENCQAIRYFQQNGGLFALASGRPPKFLMNWFDRVCPNSWSAMFNGALLYAPDGGTAYSCPTDDLIWEIGERLRVAFSELEFYTVHPLPALVKVPPETPLQKELYPQPVYKIVFLVPEARSDEYIAIARRILADYPTYRCMRSTFRCLEVQRAETGKGNAVKRYRELLGDRIHTIVAAGDFENDLEMIQEADIGYAVGNAHPMLLAVADRVTVPCSQHAIARIIADIERDVKARND
jgi:hydroxymethylpyrimidine pyrophosphatase-like HAD family hydrolase